MAKATAPNDDELLAQLDDDEDESLDLLDELNEDDGDAEAWVPEEPAGIQGRVKTVRTIRSDFAEDVLIPVVVIQDAEGKTWRIVGYATVLRREIEDAAPKPGDTFAVRYYGEKELKTGRFAGRMFKHYRVAVRRAQHPAA